MSAQSLRFRVVFLAASALLVCSAFLVYLTVSDKPPEHLSAGLTRSAAELRAVENRLQPSGLDYDSSPFISRVSGIQLSAVPSRPLLPSSKTFVHTLGVASQVFVLSLPRRLDRRMIMDALSHALDFAFVYMDGVEAADASIDQIVRVLRLERHAFRQNFLGRTTTGGALNVTEEERPDVDDLVGAESVFNLLMSLDVVAALSDGEFKFDGPLDLLCATPEDPFPASLNTTELGLFPPWRILSRGMIACWIGHLNIMRQILKLQLEVAIVLEDDVDLEYDISQRLMDMWPALPRDGWDIVMLGTFLSHCVGSRTFVRLFVLLGSSRGHTCGVHCIDLFIAF
jgi:Glycosyltransferase family 25 (LPS biosynthesis protein)